MKYHLFLLHVLFTVFVLHGMETSFVRCIEDSASPLAYCMEQISLDPTASSTFNAKLQSIFENKKSLDLPFREYFLNAMLRLNYAIYYQKNQNSPEIDHLYSYLSERFNISKQNKDNKSALDYVTADGCNFIRLGLIMAQLNCYRTTDLIDEMLAKILFTAIDQKNTPLVCWLLDNIKAIYSKDIHFLWPLVNQQSDIQCIFPDTRGLTLLQFIILKFCYSQTIPEAQEYMQMAEHLLNAGACPWKPNTNNVSAINFLQDLPTQSPELATLKMAFDALLKEKKYCNNEFLTDPIRCFSRRNLH